LLNFEILARGGLGEFGLILFTVLLALVLFGLRLFKHCEQVGILLFKLSHLVLFLGKHGLFHSVVE
jgi:hypothetical protein